MDEQNPVLLQVSGRWHIVEHSRRSQQTLCGQRITRRGAHARLSLVGERHVCPTCLELFKTAQLPDTT